jgi:hypothetical protein
MTQLTAEPPKADVADDVFSTEMLELRAVGSGIFGEGDQVKGSSQVTVVIRCNIGNEVRRSILPDWAIPNAHCHSISYLEV